MSADRSVLGLVVLVGLSPINYDHQLMRVGTTFPVRPGDAQALLECGAARLATAREVAAYAAGIDDCGSARGCDRPMGAILCTRCGENLDALARALEREGLELKPGPLR